MSPTGNQRPLPCRDFLFVRYQKDLSYNNEATLYSQFFFFPGLRPVTHVFRSASVLAFFSWHVVFQDMNWAWNICWMLLFSGRSCCLLHIFERPAALPETLWRTRKQHWVDSWSGQWQPFQPVACFSSEDFSLWVCSEGPINHTWNPHLWASKWPERHSVCCLK